MKKRKKLTKSEKASRKRIRLSNIRDAEIRKEREKLIPEFWKHQINPVTGFRRTRVLNENGN